MAITITTAEIKRKAMISDSDTRHDSAIGALIAEMQGPVEYSIAARYLEDTADTGLQATLKLGITEMITGEFIEQLRREAGASEEFSVAGVSVGKSVERGLDLIQQGALRLAPYLKAALPAMADTSCSSTSLDREPEFSLSEEVW